MKNYLEYNKYIGTVNFSAGDAVFYGKLEGIDDLVLFEGDTVVELKSAFIDAVDDYIEMCKEIGKEPNKTYKGVFNIRVPSEVHKQISIIATKKEMKLNELINKTLGFLLKHEELVLNSSK